MASKKSDYLDALTHAITNPRDRQLDDYLGSLIDKVKPREDWVDQFKAMPGLDSIMLADGNVVYLDDDPVANARYDEIKRSRNG